MGPLVAIETSILDETQAALITPQLKIDKHHPVRPGLIQESA